MIIKRHTSIHAIIHEANNRTKLEQYIKHMKQQVKRFQKCSTHCYEHTDAKITKIGAKIEKLQIKQDFL